MQDPQGASYFNQLLIFQITSPASLPPTLSFSYYSLAYSPIAHHPPPLYPRKVGQFRRPRTRRPGSSGADSRFCGANGKRPRTQDSPRAPWCPQHGVLRPVRPSRAPQRREPLAAIFKQPATLTSTRLQQAAPPSDPPLPVWLLVFSARRSPYLLGRK